MAEQKPAPEVEKVFKRFDEDGDGKISARELGNVVRALGSEVSPQEVEVMIQEMDSDRDGFVDIKEFEEFHYKGRVDGDDQLKDAFDMYDQDGNGLISALELHMVLKRLGEKCSVEDCKRMIAGVDADGDGCVDFEEFRMMMSGGDGGVRERDD